MTLEQSIAYCKGQSEEYASTPVVLVTGDIVSIASSFFNHVQLFVCDRKSFVKWMEMAREFESGEIESEYVTAPMSRFWAIDLAIPDSVARADSTVPTFVPHDSPN